MKITKQNLQQAVSENIITKDQASKLYAFLQNQYKNTAQFTFTHVLYYLGGLIAVGAMTIFLGLSWESFGGAGIVTACIIYAIIGLKLTQYFSQKDLSIPAGICATFVVCLTPLAIYGLQQWLGLWPTDNIYKDYHRSVKWHWLFMELGTLLIGWLILIRYKYAFLIMPIAITLWYMAMDISAMLYGENFNWQTRKLVSLCTGLVMLIIAFVLDIKFYKKADYAFWIYLFGALAFWLGLTTLDSKNELSRFFYLCINLGMIAVGAVLARRIFVILGAIGTSIYLGHLATHIFKNDWVFPMALTLLGLSIIFLGMLWQKNEKILTKKMRAKLPSSFQALLKAKE